MNDRDIAAELERAAGYHAKEFESRLRKWLAATDREIEAHEARWRDDAVFNAMRPGGEQSNGTFDWAALDDPPVVTGDFWRGVGWGLLISVPAWLLLALMAWV